jgi:prepilin-type N-terminal cleavage/methylation domain-containing protein
MTHTKKGFTLIELLIVIGILAILATTVVLVLNPAQLLAETRDTQRFSDLDSLKSAIALYLTAVSSPDLSSGSFLCRDETPPGRFGSSLAGAPSPFGTTGSFPAIANAGVRAVDGTGWVAVDFTNAALGGSPIPTLPIDPSQQLGTGGLPGTGRYYAYTCNNANKTFELNANLESTKYSAGGPSDREGSDGGTFATDGVAAQSLIFANLVYEVGNDPGLDL